MLRENLLFQQGISEFKARDYYRCHDSLEALWLETVEPEKTFVQGILQIAVACYHLTNANGKGGMILLGEGIKRLKEYQPEFEQIDVKTLVLTSAHFLYALQSLEDEDILAVAVWVKSAVGEAWQAPDGSYLSLPELRQVA